MSLYAPAGHRRRGHARAGRRRRRHQAGARRRRPLPRRARHHRCRPRPPRGRGGRAPRGRQLRRLDRRRRRRDGRGGGDGGQRRGRGQRRPRGRRERRAHRAHLDRLRLRRHQARAVARVGCGEPDRRLRALEARRRGAGGGRDRRARDRPHGLALRRRRAQLRRHDARARRGARRGERRDRPGGQPDVDRAPRRGAGRARRARRRRRDPARDGRRRLLVVRAGGRDLRPRGPALPRPADHVGPLPAAGAAPRLLGPGDRARRGARAAGLAGRGRGLPEREGGGGPMRLLVCGGAGFIGSNFVRVRVRDHGDEVVVLDKLTYAGRRENLQDIGDVRLAVGGIEDPDTVAEAAEGADAIVNFAAEPPRARSISEPAAFINTHALGTYVLLEAARERGLRYVQVSTDEVYGSIEEGSFTEQSPLNPSSPYSATKAGADLLVASYRHTFGLETLICRGSNNYGPYQYPEKLIPLMVLNALHGDKLPVYGDGMQVRNCIFVEDFARGIGHVLEHGAPGEAYNVGGPDEAANIHVVRRILELTGAPESLIEHVADRPGHDRRYSLGSEKVRALGWEPQVRFADGLERTVQWYRDNVAWWEPIRSGAYREYYTRQYGRALG